MTTSILATPIITQIFTAFSLTTTVNCGSISYTLSDNLPFVTVSSTGLSISVNPTLPSEINIYPTNIVGKLDDYPSVLEKQVPFKINVLACQVTGISSQVNAISNGGSKEYIIGDPAITYTFYYD